MKQITKTLLLFTIIFVMGINNSTAGLKKDHLKCSLFIENIKIKYYSSLMYVELIQSVIAFSHEVSYKSIEKMEKQAGVKANDGDFDELLADSYFNSQITIQLLTFDSVVKQCTEDPRLFLEVIGRAKYIATQEITPKYPKMNWKLRYRKQAEESIKNY